MYGSTQIYPNLAVCCMCGKLEFVARGFTIRTMEYYVFLMYHNDFLMFQYVYKLNFNFETVNNAVKNAGVSRASSLLLLACFYNNGVYRTAN